LLLKTTLGLDFDDAYQYEIAKEYNFIIGNNGFTF